MIPVLLALGSNLGERAQHLRLALRHLGRERRLRLRACSGWRETDPVGGPRQGRYVNAALWCEVSMEPLVLLERLQLEERRRGRAPGGPRNGPRTLDLDILLFGPLVLATPRLEIPHPRMLERDFVMLPALQLVPRWIHPHRRRSLAGIWEG